MLTSNQIAPQKINWPGFLALFAAVLGLVISVGLGYSIPLSEGGSPEEYPALMKAVLYSVPALALLIGILFYLVIRYRTRADLLKVWVLFAEANDLWYDLRNSFFPPLLFKEPPYRQVTGVYYGHTLSMWTRHKTYRVSALPADGPLPSPPPGLEILHHLPTELFDARGLLASGTGWISLDRHGAVAYESKPALFYMPGPAGRELNWLRALSEKLGELADAVPFIIEMGGEAVPKLQVIGQSPTFAPFAIQLIRRIGVDTRKRLADRVDTLICPKCLARFTIHLIKMPRGRPIEVCGCRVCGQSREFETWTGRIVAVLDEAQPEPTRQTGDTLYRNWVALKRPFDFDAVEIRRACDEQIGRFAMQIGNDPDPRRRARYGQLTCRVSDPTLSANSRRVLESVFGQVVG